jgi:hypothetical protein
MAAVAFERSTRAYAMWRFSSAALIRLSVGSAPGISN